MDFVMKLRVAVISESKKIWILLSRPENGAHIWENVKF